MTKTVKRQELMVHQINGSLFHQRKPDGYINATEFCQMHEKEVYEFLRLPSTQKYIDFLNTGKSRIIEVVFTQKGKGGGTWIHPKLAIHLWQWISVEMMDLVSDIVLGWMSNGCNRPTAKKPERTPEYLQIESQAKETRKSLGDAMKECGKNGLQIIGVTDQIYRGLFGKSSKELRKERFVVMLIETKAKALLMSEYQVNGIVSSGDVGRTVKMLCDNFRLATHAMRNSQLIKKAAKK